MEELIRPLEAKGYVLLARFGFGELMIPVWEGLRARNLYGWLFKGIMLLAVILLAADGWHTGLSGKQHFIWLAWSLPATFLLVPLHELIHAWVLRWYGARDVRFGAIWRYLAFYAVAHRFVVNYRQFLYIALAPFITVSLACAITWFFVPDHWQVLLLGVFSFHAFCCAGDFGLCAYFYKYRRHQPVSFDDADNHITYFYILPFVENFTQESENP